MWRRGGTPTRLQRGPRETPESSQLVGWGHGRNGSAVNQLSLAGSADWSGRNLSALAAEYARVNGGGSPQRNAAAAPALAPIPLDADAPRTPPRAASSASPAPAASPPTRVLSNLMHSGPDREDEGEEDEDADAYAVGSEYESDDPLADDDDADADQRGRDSGAEGGAGGEGDEEALQLELRFDAAMSAAAAARSAENVDADNPDDDRDLAARMPEPPAQPLTVVPRSAAHSPNLHGALRGVHIPGASAAAAAQPASSAAASSTFAQSVALAERFLSGGSSAAADTNWSASAGAPGAPALTAFTVYMEGYLKRKVTAPVTFPSATSGAASGPSRPPGPGPGQALEVVRGKAGTSLYLVWHSKGLSVYGSREDYRRDRRPLRQMLNAWNKVHKNKANNKAKATPDNEEEEDFDFDPGHEELELMMVPYRGVPGSGKAGRKINSASLLRQAKKDSLLLRLLLCYPSALQRDELLDAGSPAGAHAQAPPPPPTTLMVLKAGSVSLRNQWLAASSLIHCAHARDRVMHTRVLPMLARLFDDPEGFLRAHPSASSRAVLMSHQHDHDHDHERGLLEERGDGGDEQDEQQQQQHEEQPQGEPEQQYGHTRSNFLMPPDRGLSGSPSSFGRLSVIASANSAQERGEEEEEEEDEAEHGEEQDEQTGEAKQLDTSTNQPPRDNNDHDTTGADANTDAGADSSVQNDGSSMQAQGRPRPGTLAPLVMPASPPLGCIAPVQLLVSADPAPHLGLAVQSDSTTAVVTAAASTAGSSCVSLDAGTRSSTSCSALTADGGNAAAAAAAAESATSPSPSQSPSFSFSPSASPSLQGRAGGGAGSGWGEMPLLTPRSPTSQSFVAAPPTPRSRPNAAAAAAAASCAQAVSGQSAPALTSPCEFYGLNGETPLFPELPLQELSLFATDSSGLRKSFATGGGGGAVAAAANTPRKASAPVAHAHAHAHVCVQSLSASSPRSDRLGSSFFGGASSPSPSPSAPSASAADSALLTLEQMGPRKASVDELLGFVLLHWPGSSFTRAIVSGWAAASAVGGPMSPASAGAAAVPSPAPSPSSHASARSGSGSGSSGDKLGPAPAPSPGAPSRTQVQMALLMYRAAIIDSEALLDRLEGLWLWAWSALHPAPAPSPSPAAPSLPPPPPSPPLSLPPGTSPTLTPHGAHHLLANVLHLLLVWVVHFRRDYLSAQGRFEALLRGVVYPHVALWEKERAGAGVGCTRTCAEHAEADERGDGGGSNFGAPRCLNLTLLASQLSHTIALTAGLNTPALASFLPTPLPTLEEQVLGGEGGLHPSLALALSSSGGTAAGARPGLARAASSPHARRMSFAAAGRSASRSALDLSVLGPLGPSEEGADPPTGGDSPLAGTSAGAAAAAPVLRSQAHRLPAAMARRASSQLFLKKFVPISPSSLSLLCYPARAIAAEMTRQDLDLLACVHAREVVHKGWTGAGARAGAVQAAHVLHFIDTFNRRSFLVASEVLRAGGAGAGAGAGGAAAGGQNGGGSGGASGESATSARLQVLQHFISIMHELVLLCNYSGAFALLNGLQLQPLHRLRALWSLLPAHSAQQASSVREGVCSGANNFSAYRQELRRCARRQLAFIPHFGVLLKDLFQLEEIPTWAQNPQASGTDPAPVAVAELEAPQLNWHKYARQYVEVHNGLFLAQNNAHLYERAQIVKESGEIAEANAAAAATAAAGAAGANGLGSPARPSLARSQSTSALSRSQAPPSPGAGAGGFGPASSSLLRPPLAASDPSVRMCLHLCFQRLLSEEKLYQLSYRCEPKK